MTSPEYSESQHLPRFIVWPFCGALDAFYLFAFIRQVVFGIPVGNRPAPDLFYWFFILVIAALNYLLFSVRLDFHVNAERIQFKFAPFQRSWTTIEMKDIQSLYLRSYKPISEFGGWGYRISLFGGGKALTMWGSQGLQIITSSSSKILLGTQNEKVLREFLENSNLMKMPGEDAKQGA